MKGYPVLHSAKASHARFRTGAITLLILIQVVGGSLARVSGSPSPVSWLPSDKQSKAQSNPCIPPAPSPGPGTNGEYQPSYLVRSVAHSAKSGRKYVGNHLWCETDPTSHSLRWESDAVNVMNDFIICRYDLGPEPVGDVFLEFRGGQIDFINKDWSGAGAAFALAVYENAAPATLFRGKTINFGKPLFAPRKWAKLEKNNRLDIDSFTVPIKLRPGVRQFSVVLVGIDSWIDTKIAIQIFGLKVLARSAVVQRPMRKKS